MEIAPARPTESEKNERPAIGLPLPFLDEMPGSAGRFVTQKYTKYSGTARFLHRATVTSADRAISAIARYFQIGVNLTIRTRAVIFNAYWVWCDPRRWVRRVDP